MNPVSAEVWENREVAGGIYRLKLRPLGPAPHVAPGRFFMVQVGQGHDPLLRRPLGHLRTVRNEDGIHLVEFLYEARGRGTASLARISPPATISFIGPLGSGWRLDPLPKRVILVAGGMGVVPAYAAARHLSLLPKPPETDLIFGARGLRELVLLDDIKELPCRLSTCTEDGCVGEEGLVTDLLGPMLGGADSEESAVLACGPRPMLRAVAAMARERGVACQVSLEARMGCGMGACLTCSVAGADGRNRRVCKEGPVFMAGEIDWEALDDSP